MKKRITFLTVIRMELRLITTDTASKLTCSLTIAMMIYALGSGMAFSLQRERSVWSLKASALEKISVKKIEAQAIAEGKQEIPDKPYRDPGNTIYIGSSLSGLAALPQMPLSFLSAGESDLYPAAIEVSARGKEHFLFDDEICNPTHLLSGLFDPAFVIAVLLPLFILALTYNIISGERELGTLPLNASSPLPLQIIMVAKLLVRTAVPLFVATLLLLGTTACISPGSLPTMLVFTGCVILYGLFWGFAALVINGFGFDSTGNVLVASVLWIVTVFIVPALIDAVVELSFPSLPRTAMVLKVRNATVEADATHNAAQSQYEMDHIGTSLAANNTSQTGTEMLLTAKREKNIQRLRNIKIAQTVGDSVYAIQQKILAERKGLADKLKFLSPVMIMQDIAAQVTGNGSCRYTSFFTQVDRFHDIWRNHFITRAEQDIRLDSAGYNQFPRFQFIESAVTESRKRISEEIAAIACFLLIAAGASQVLLNHYRVVSG